MVAQRFCGQWNVIGADLLNEPWGGKWGEGGEQQDWAKAAERLGATVLGMCPRCTIYASHSASLLTACALLSPLHRAHLLSPALVRACCVCCVVCAMRVSLNRWAIFVEGVGASRKPSQVFWGENLEGVRWRPLKLPTANKVVYSPHV